MATKRSLDSRKRRGGKRRPPNVNSLAFRAAAHLQSLAIAHSLHEKRDQEFVDAISDNWNHD